MVSRPAYDNHPVSPPAHPRVATTIKRHADKTIEFIRDAKVIAPDKPWFSYVCPGASMRRTTSSGEWADRYAGRFDMGYEGYREIVLERQRSCHPSPNRHKPLSDVPNKRVDRPLAGLMAAVDSLSDEEKERFCRME